MGELTRISIALLGGSTSGKTTFFSGIYNAFISQHVRHNGKVLSLVPKFLNYGSFEEPEEIVDPIETIYSSSDGVIDWNAEPEEENSSVLNSTKSVISHSIEVNGLADSAMLSREMEKLWALNQNGSDTGFQYQTSPTRFVELVCELRIDSEPKCVLVITDYAGELLDLHQETSKAMLGRLSKYIENSDAAIVLANSQELNKHIVDEIVQEKCMFKRLTAQEAVQATRINALINDLMTEDYCFLISLTQCDSPSLDERLKGDVKNQPFARVCNDLANFIFQPAFSHAFIKNWCRGVVPISAISYDPFGVSVVDENGTILEGADIGQWNIDVALLFCIYNAAIAKNKKISSQLDSLGPSIFNRERSERKRLLVDQRHRLYDIIELINGYNGLFNDIYLKYEYGSGSEIR